MLDNKILLLLCLFIAVFLHLFFLQLLQLLYFLGSLRHNVPLLLHPGLCPGQLRLYLFQPDSGSHQHRITAFQDKNRCPLNLALSDILLDMTDS